VRTILTHVDRALSTLGAWPRPTRPCRARVDSPLGTRPSREPSRRGPAWRKEVFPHPDVPERSPNRKPGSVSVPRHSRTIASRWSREKSSASSIVRAVCSRGRAGADGVRRRSIPTRAARSRAGPCPRRQS
jgi:hypothetical protein